MTLPPFSNLQTPNRKELLVLDGGMWAVKVGGSIDLEWLLAVREKRARDIACLLDG